MGDGLRKKLFVGATVLALGLAGCAPSFYLADEPVPTLPPTEPTAAPTEPPIPEVTFTVVGTGDVLSHMPVVRNTTQADGSHDYSALVADVKPFIEGADLALCHEEVPMTFDASRVSGYPVFAAPADWVNSVVSLGYDGCSTASNHSWDQGRGGVFDTLNILREHGLGNVGTSLAADQDQIQYYEIEKDGRTIKVAHMSFAYGLNYEVVPEVNENPWLVNINNPEHMVELAKQAREEGADVVIVSAHGGAEYVAEPTERQHEWSRIFADSGVIDVYLGHHAHVPQPIGKVEGGPGGHGMWAFYGTGNMLSSMQPSQGLGTQVGYIATATITVPPEGAAEVDAGYTGFVLDRDTSQIFEVSKYNQADHPGSRLTNEAAATYIGHLRSVMGDAKEVTEAPSSPAPPVHVIERAVPSQPDA